MNRVIKEAVKRSTVVTDNYKREMLSAHLPGLISNMQHEVDHY